ncbi:MAG: rubredoxin [Flavobacteriales bacterium]|nr:rubredoxin [Flavobacteriales bacterium]
MNQKNSRLSRYIVKGGVLSLSELKRIIHIVKQLEIDYISFGSRQDIMFPYSELNHDLLDNPNFIIPSEDEIIHENIVSSYVTSDIFNHTSWLTGTKHLYILESFRFLPTLKINIVDPKQSLVPLFTGDLNFIASEEEDYWYLYLKLPNWKNSKRYPVLIYSWDMAKLAEKIENTTHFAETEVEDLFNYLNQQLDLNSRNITQDLDLKYIPFPYYEGMSHYGLDQYWLGLYWRNNKYDINFLDALCNICIDSSVSKINITPWKSIILKGILKKDKIFWENFLGKHGINIRHSQLELNWHLPVNDKEALDLKSFLVKSLDQYDVSTYGLSIGVTNFSQNKQYFNSIIIQKNQLPEEVSSLNIRDTYNILYAQDFNPNTRKYIVYVQDIDKVEIPKIIMELSKMYFNKSDAKIMDKSDKKSTTQTNRDIYQCVECLSVYDELVGDEIQNIPKGTRFQDLPKHYQCQLCESPTSSFVKKNI